MEANPPRQFLTLQESARTKRRRSPPLRLLQQRNLSELDQSNLRQSKLKKQNLRGCVCVEAGEEGRAGEVTAAWTRSPKDETRVFSPAGLWTVWRGMEAVSSYGCELLRIQLSFWALRACIFSNSMKAAFGVCTFYTCARVLTYTPVCFPEWREKKREMATVGKKVAGVACSRLTRWILSVFFRLWSSAAIYLFINPWVWEMQIWRWCWAK